MPSRVSSASSSIKMPVRVITPPAPIVTPADIAGAHAADDAGVAALIQAVTEEIDGPDGWLGRSLGTQTLELVEWIGCRRFRLPCGPVIGIESVITVDCDGNQATVDPSTWRQDGDDIVIADGASWVTRYRHRIRYKAGYNGTSGAGVGEVQTGAVPERARQAIILSVQHLKSLGTENLYLKTDEVDGIGRKEWTLSEVASKVVDRACDRLLSTLRVYS